MTYADQLRDLISDPRTTPDRVVLQFSTAAPIWRKWTPQSIKRRGDSHIITSPFNKNYASPIIRRLCHSPFSHVDFVLPDGNLLGASDQGPDSPCIEGNPRGVAVRPPDYQLFGRRRNMIILTDKAQYVYAYAIGQLGKPFDNSALWQFLSEGTAPERDWRDPNQWFCAELVPYSFELGAYWWPRKLIWPKDRFSPTDVILLFMGDPNFINRDTFWDFMPGLRGTHPEER